MIPNVDPDGIDHLSERSTYIALRDGLSSQYTVFHSYPWLRPWRGDRDKALTEGETDFIITHRQYGLLVLELKGGEIATREKRWFRDTQHGPVEIRDPFEQAKRNMHALLEIIEDFSHGIIHRSHLVSGFSVVFPDLDYEGRPPANADRAIIICQRHLSHIADSITLAYRAWTAEPRPLDRDRYAHLLRCLMQEFKFIRPIGPELEAASQRIYELTDMQSEAYRTLLTHSPRALIEGPAGSGKTELAIQRALRFAQDGKRTLFVCYNKHLAGWLRGRLDCDPHANMDPPDQLEIWNFHALASHLAERARVPWRSLSGTTGQTFWDEEVPTILNQAVNVLEGQGEQVRYDAIVVDEAQDFRELWWYTLTEDLLVSDDAPLQVFLDAKQCLWGDVMRPEIGLPPPILLDTNCRNTKRVAEFSARTVGLTAKTYRFAPEGIPATILRVASQGDQLAAVQQRVRRLLNVNKLSGTQIALLGPASKERGSLASLTRINGVRLVSAVSDWTNGAGILVSTARSFKGLEADAILVYDVGALGSLFTEADLYVACTRAVYVLELIVHDENLCAHLRQASAAP